MLTWLEDALAERFEPVAVLKESDRGSVTKLRHRDTGTWFILRRMSGGNEVYRKLLEIRCPHLPLILETAGDGERTLVLEEYILGNDLGDILTDGLFSPQDTQRLGLQLCRALWVLHSLGAVHRYVKPENVLLRGDDAILIDFDAARLFKKDREADTVARGTTGFAAPEQYGLTQSDARADVYSMGVLLNVMRTGEHPSKKLAPGRLGRIVSRCVQTSPKKRYQSILQLADELA